MVTRAIEVLAGCIGDDGVSFQSRTRCVIDNRDMFTTLEMRAQKRDQAQDRATVA
jgi:hypothetical protein